MKKIDFGQTISIFASLGVIAGTIFLGFELRQNNALMASQSRANQTQQVLALQSELLLDADLAEIIYKADAGEPLTGTEQLRTDALLQKIFLGMQFQFEEFQNGTLEKSWAVLKDVLRPEFREYFETNVVAD